MKTKKRMAPQRLAAKADVCDCCGAVDSFRVTGRVRGVAYLRCAECGRRATRMTAKISKPKTTEEGK